MGVFHVKGCGPKSSVCPSKPRETKFFGWISRDFARISRNCPKSLRKESLCSILGPKTPNPAGRGHICGGNLLGVPRYTKFFLQSPPSKAILWGVAAIVCDTTENTERQEYCYTCLAMGGVFGSGH